MTTDHTQLPTLAELRATLTERNRKYDQAMQDVVDGQLELLSATWAALERGEATWPDLYAVAEQCRAGNVGGWTVRWNEVVPISWQKVQYYAQQGTPPPLPKPRRAPARYLTGRWSVSRTKSGRASDTCPGHGTYVVYELFDDADALIYIGATVDLAGRLRGHSEKPWAKCAAREARDKIDAEGLEAVAILAKQPPLNKQLTHWGGPSTLMKAADLASVATPELQAIAETLTGIAASHVAANDMERYAQKYYGRGWLDLYREDSEAALGLFSGGYAIPRTATWEQVAAIIRERAGAPATEPVTM